MTRPWALIQGDLALPNARLLSGLPAPFGLKPQPVRTGAQQEPLSAVRDETQQANRRGVQARVPATPRDPVTPGSKFVFFYKLPPQREYSDRFDAQLAEARRYLEMGKARPRSSRSDHVVGAAIFLSCSIALAWLLSTCATRDANKTTSVAVTRPVVPLQGGPGVALPKAHAEARSADALTDRSQTLGSEVSTALDASRHQTGNASPATDTAPKIAFKAEPTQMSPRAESHLATRGSRRNPETTLAAAKPAGRVAMARLTQAQVEARVALIRVTSSATKPSLSHQTEWTAQASSTHDTAERAALLDWAARQRRASVTLRATVPAPGETEIETDWNARMTQRRITDNPAAFQVNRGQP